MLRLDAAHPPLWRTPTSLQFGVEPVAALDDPAPWEERMIHELGRGLPERAVEPVARAWGAEPGAADRLLRRLAPALETRAPERARGAVIRVPVGFDPADARAVADAVRDSGIPARLVTGDDDVSVSDDETVVLLAAHIVDPRVAADLLRDDVPHLPIVFSGARAIVGPLVRPGATACLMCVEAQRRDADPAWPALAAQLLGRAGAPVGRAFALEAGLVAARLLNESDEPARSAHSVTIRADSSRRSWQAHPPHEECRCRSLGGTATPIAPDIPYRLVTRTPTTSARSA